MNHFLEDFDFGNEAGDDIEPQELQSYFVEQRMFKKFKNPKNKILVATAKKGVGKSALIQWLKYTLENDNDDYLVIKIRGADLFKAALDSKLSTPNEYIQQWMQRICSAINMEMANIIDFAFTDDQITIIETAELHGFKQKNIVSTLTSRFKKTLGKIAPDQNQVANHHQLLKRFESKKRVWFLIDDLDATFQNNSEELLLLGTFFTACRYLTQDIKGLNFRITMRSDVWPLIRRSDEALDKLEQYIHEIRWKEADFRKILSKRIIHQAKENEINIIQKHKNQTNEEFDEKIISYIFEPKVRWSEKDQYTYKVIYTLAYYRPRWAIQLCKLARENAIKRNSTKICKDHIDTVWGFYGNKRIADLISEHKHQCKTIEELLNAFRGSDRRMNRDTLLTLIKNKIVNHVNVVIEGQGALSSKEIANFLFRIGFIVARSEDTENINENDYQHYHFDDLPDLLTSRTSSDFNVFWEIHPCFREALDIKKLNKSMKSRRITGHK